MPNLYIFNSNKLALVKRLGLFSVGLILFYLLVLCVFSNIRPLSTLTEDHTKNFSLHQLIARNYFLPGWSGQSLKRFREIENYQNIDILFIGSSHCLRSFDPRTFARMGVTSFNMGSNSQAPLNTYFLLEKYMDQLNPKLVVFEIYPGILKFDGLEGYYDLLVNQNLSKEIVEMAVAVNNPQSINTLVTKAAFSFTSSFDTLKQHDIRNETYIKGGYLSAEVVHPGKDFGPSGEIKVSDTQVNYLHKIIEFIKSRGSEVLLVVAPIPEEYQATITNYDDVAYQISAVARQHDIQFYDFNESLILNTRDQFRDAQHMNANGAKVFSYALIDSLLDVETYSRILNVQPQYAADIYCGRGISLASKGKLEEALRDYNKALALMPNYYKAYINRAIVFTHKNQYEAAISDFEKAVAIDPTSDEIYFSMARIYEMMGKNNEAATAYLSFIDNASAELEQYVVLAREKVNLLRDKP